VRGVTVVEPRTDEREKLTQLMDLRLHSASSGAGLAD
jgi:hypothetical protein